MFALDEPNPYTGRTVLHSAATANVNYAAAEMLRKRGVSVTVADKDGDTPLHIAAEVCGEAVSIVAARLMLVCAV
jgi:ankyrin repeat protein